MNEPQVWTVIGVLSATLIGFATAAIGFFNAQFASLRRELDAHFRRIDARFEHLDRDVRAVAARVFGTDRD